MINTDELKRLRDICDAATPGPWYSMSTLAINGEWCVVREGPGIPKVTYENRLGLRAEVNTILMAESRTAIPKLLDEVERLKKQVAAAPWMCVVCGKEMEQEERHD